MKKLAQVLDRILKVIYWLLVIMLPIGILMTLWANSVWSESAQPSTLLFPISYDYQGLTFSLESRLENHMLILNGTTITSVITGLVLLYSFKQVRNILEAVIEENPFSLEVVRCIKRLAFCTIFGSLISSITTTVIDFSVFQSLNIVESLNQIGVKVHFWWSIFEGSLIFEGLLILLLAHVFQYGLRLQEEYDATL